ncbi:MAG TPA: 3-oxoacyl-[acyl-carrier-protein] reductase [Rickettsiales bacterium]|nr:3-oxoacyl-[acyl-carrier-protein] reductase [Rickettsiales bacterium]
MMNLTGKTALVTGASGGIGGAIAKALHNNGAKLVISGTRKEALDALNAELGGAATPITCNLSDGASIEALIKESEAALGQIDILVCNAGVTRDNLSMRMKDEEWQQVIDVNLTATFRLVRAAMKGMLKRRNGRIINITSIVGTMGNPGQANYCASKAGIAGMTKAIAQEVASRNVTVNCVAPGFIKTAMTDALNEEQQKRITNNIPAARFGLPEDVAGSVLFLASEAAAYITGQTLHVNGGLLMV